MSLIRLIGSLQLRPILTLSSCTSNTAGIARYSSQSSFPVKFTEIEGRWKEKDGVSKTWNLIYKAPMNNVLTYLSTYLTVTTGAVAGIGAYYAAFAFNEDNLNKPILLGEDVLLANSPAEGLVYVTAFFIFHILVKLFLSKYVVRIYQNGDKYIAVYRGHIHTQIVKHEFKLAEFEKTNPFFLSAWGKSKFKLGSKQGIILENYFKAPEYFNRLLFKRPPRQSEID